MIVTRRTLLGSVAVGGALAATPALAAAEPGDMTLGNPTSPVQVLEYASLTCPHCAAFHAEIFPQIQVNYIDAGRIGFTLREFPTPPAPVAVAMFQLARCGGAGTVTYYDRVAELFHAQRAILETGTNIGVRDALIAIGAGWGLTQEQVLMAISDPSGVERIRATMESGAARYAIHATPTLIVNDRPVEGITYEAVSGAIEAALAR